MRMYPDSGYSGKAEYWTEFGRGVSPPFILRNLFSARNRELLEILSAKYHIPTALYRQGFRKKHLPFLQINVFAEYQHIEKANVPVILKEENYRNVCYKRFDEIVPSGNACRTKPKSFIRFLRTLFI